MTNYREILRLSSLGFKNTQIAESVDCSRTTVIKVVSLAKEKGILYLDAESASDKWLSEQFGNTESKPEYEMPDYDTVYHEMQHSGVTLNLLWLEYCDKCRDAEKTPYQLTQSKKYYIDYLVKTTATMHLNHKPGEIMQVIRLVQKFCHSH